MKNKKRIVLVNDMASSGEVNIPNKGRAVGFYHYFIFFKGKTLEKILKQMANSKSMLLRCATMK